MPHDPELQKPMNTASSHSMHDSRRPDHPPGAGRTVSIIVTPACQHSRIDELLGVLTRDGKFPSGVELIIVRTHSLLRAEGRYAGRGAVRCVDVAPGTPPAELRAEGLRHASGDVVVLLDDHDVLDIAALEALCRPSAPRAEAGDALATG